MEKTTHTWWAADKRAGSNAEKAAAAAADDDWKCCEAVVDTFDPRIDEGILTYGATRHGSKGVDTGGLWLDIIIPGNIKKRSLTPNEIDLSI